MQVLNYSSMHRCNFLHQIFSRAFCYCHYVDQQSFHLLPFNSQLIIFTQHPIVFSAYSIHMKRKTAEQQIKQQVFIKQQRERQIIDKGIETTLTCDFSTNFSTETRRHQNLPYAKCFFQPRIILSKGISQRKPN